MATEIDEEKSDSSSSSHLSEELSFPFESYQLENQKAKLLINPFEVERELVYPRPKAHYEGVLDRIMKSWKRKPEIKRGVPKHRKGKWLAFGFLFLLLLIVLITVPIVTQKSKRAVEVPRADNYSIALKQALLFFDAQKSGHLVHNRVPWRGDSGLHDGGGRLVGGFYDGGENIKYTFPTAFSMTMLSWSVLEFGHHYRATGEYDHVTEIIRWGVDYILKTFDSTSNYTVSHIYSQVGVAKSNSTMPDDGYCWQRPEDVTYRRSYESVIGGPDLAGEMIAALASASLVFREDELYSRQLIKGAEKLVEFCSLPERHYTYTGQKNKAYNSSDFHDEELWAAAWLFYATGNYEYLSRATNERLAAKTKLFSRTPSLWILSYDNKLPGALLLLTRLRIILGVPYPFEDMLQIYHKVLEKMMCSYMHQYGVLSLQKED
ncbi:endoglucanase 12-like [Papaver somniferum]|uniref:endoglucanase 12-like n=1 Tax=Papaver somniferum TaxID=3469 RepID=UPI000E6FB5CA|nr:endoglucanase 12-like [Papaver somniferum]